MHLETCLPPRLPTDSAEEPRINLEHRYSLRVFTDIGQQLALISGATEIPALVEDLLESLNSDQNKTKIYFDSASGGTP